MWAHSSNGRLERHSLADHLRSTAALARTFGDAFGAGEFCAALGLLHDAGKAAVEWQRRLLAVDGTDLRVGLDHKELGARLLERLAGYGGMCVLGHHGGLGDKGDWRSVLDKGDDTRGQDAEVVSRLVAAVPEVDALLRGPRVKIPTGWRDPLVGEMGLRLAFSALVDADHLDTAAHFDGLEAPQIAAPVDMADLLARFETTRAALLARRPVSPVDGVRSELYEAAVRAAAGPTGIYRLPAPTGAGKTLTAAGFALHHAARHRKSRVIVAVPYLTITEQNAKVYRDLLGAEVVMEHHSAVDVEDDRRARLGAENWDSPFVVTTTVQLFDSLFGRKPSRSRKLHRLANAVVVLDEVQSLPMDLLLPILDGLRRLSEHFETTVLLASATQPSFQRLAPWRPIRDQIREIVKEPPALYERLRRVTWSWRVGEPSRDMAAVADEIVAHRQALVVVSTVGHARNMLRLLAGRRPGDALHLSTRMCPVHRTAVLVEAQRRLASGEPVLLVSTQLIEAGVDVDFPVVFRAMAPAESLLQAAGRCNREGRRAEPGLVVVFDAVDAPVPPFYRTAVAQTRLYFGPDGAEPDDLPTLDLYYRAVYGSLNTDGNERGTTIQGNREKLNFAAVADGPRRDAGALAAPAGSRDRALAFRMLDDDSVPVVVTTYGERARVADLLCDLRSGEGPRRSTFRALQPYTVALPTRIATRPDIRALLRPVVGDLWTWDGRYDESVGLDDADTVTATVW